MKTQERINYSTVIIDLGSGIIKAGFGGEDGPRCIFKTILGIPKKLGILVGMETKERFIGNESIEKIDIMDFSSPIKRGEVDDWDKFETILHYLFFNELKIIPEEISFLVTECPLTSKENRRKLSEMFFEVFNVDKLHIANSSMLSLYSYGQSTGLIVDSGYNVTSTVPIYEGYPLAHASNKLNIGGADLSLTLLEMIQPKINDKSYKNVKGLLLADKIKEEKGYIYLNQGGEDVDISEEKYTLPDGQVLELSDELYKHCDELFTSKDPERMSIKSCVIDSISKCDPDFKNQVKEHICLAGGTSLLTNFNTKLESDLSEEKDLNSNFKIYDNPERQFASWIGGSILSRIDNFSYMWVKKEEYDENKLDAIDSKCF